MLPGNLLEKVMWFAVTKYDQPRYDVLFSQRIRDFMQSAKGYYSVILAFKQIMV